MNKNNSIFFHHFSIIRQKLISSKQNLLTPQFLFPNALLLKGITKPLNTIMMMILQNIYTHNIVANNGEPNHNGQAFLICYKMFFSPKSCVAHGKRIVSPITAR